MSQIAQSRRVLIVDDQHELADSLARLVRVLGHDVKAVYDAATALSVARKFRPQIVFTDVAMPGETGVTLAQMLRGDPAHADCRIVALSGFTPDLFAAGRGDFDDWVVKPMELETLKRLIAKAGD